MPRIALPVEVVSVARRLHDAGYVAVLVGGGVRDSLIGRSAKDFDLATDASPEQVTRVFPRTRATTHFGTALVPEGPGGEVLEITTFRTEAGYADFRRPDSVTFTGDLVTDLARRDFTMNAIAYDPIADEIIDPFGGATDLAAGRIRTVGLPDDRFGEDALRLLRATRFASTLGFSIEPATYDSIKRHAHLVKHLARERVGIEMMRTLGGPNVFRALSTMADVGLLGQVFPDLTAARVANHNIAVLGRLDDDRPAVLLAALLHHTEHGLDAGKRAKAILSALGLGDDFAHDVAVIINAANSLHPDNESDATLIRSLRPFSQVQFEAALVVRETCEMVTSGRVSAATEHLARRAADIYASDVPLRVTDLDLDGFALINGLGIAPGREIGRLLALLLEAVTDGAVANEAEPLLSFAAAAR
jgi:tRNA nucleotidyltransferase (CCA-adding enzyme)